MPANNNQIRIIGGHWRGRRIKFPSTPGLRPTPDRIRETLFNWLNPIIVGTRCADLFAGSGALGIEALSRGAKEVVFVEQQTQVARSLQQNLKMLGVDDPKIERIDVMRWLAGPARPFDIVWLDPPFGKELLELACNALERHGWLASKAYIYLEMEHKLEPALPRTWQVEKKKTAGQVDYWLLMRQA